MRGTLKKKRTRLIAFLAVFCILAACAIGAGITVKGHAAALPQNTISYSTGPVGPINGVFNSSQVALPSINEINSESSLSVDYSIPEGEELTLFGNYPDNYPLNSNGARYNIDEVYNWIYSGNYLSQLDIDVSNPNRGTMTYALLGAVDPAGKVDTNSVGSFESYFVQECQEGYRIQSGPLKGQSLLGAALPQIGGCIGAFTNTVKADVLIGANSYSLDVNSNMNNGAIQSGFFENANFNYPANPAQLQFLNTGESYNGPIVKGPLQIKISFSPIAIYMLYQLYYYLTRCQSPVCSSQPPAAQSFYSNISYYVDPSITDGPAYSSSGARIVSTTHLVVGNSNLTVEDTSISQEYGVPNCWYTDFYEGGGFITPSSPSGPLGVWFRAGSDGKPLKQVKILLSVPSEDIYLEPAYWNPTNISQSKESYNPNLLFDSGYQYIGWLFNGVWQGEVPFTLDSIQGYPGYFGISGLPAGTYNIEILNSSEGNPSFNVTLSNYNKPETFSVASDPDKVIDSATNTVGTINSQPQAPISVTTQLLNSEGKVEITPETNINETVGESQALTYQLQTPFSSKPMKIDLNYNGYGIESSDISIAGIPISLLEKKTDETILSTSDSGISLNLDSKSLDYIKSNGFGPATFSQNSTSYPIGESNELSITFPAYLSTSFQNGDAVGYNVQSSGESTEGKVSPSALTTGLSNGLLPASLSASDNSSQTGLWFKLLYPNGIPIGSATFYITKAKPVSQTGINYNEKTVLAYLQPMKSKGVFTGWNWSPEQSIAQTYNASNYSDYLISQSSKNGTYGVGGLASGSYIVYVASPYPGLSGIPYVNFEITLSNSSPEAMTATGQDDGILYPSKDAVYVNAFTDSGGNGGYVCPANDVSSPTACSSTVDTQGGAAYSETVGIPYKNDWITFFPLPTGNAGGGQLQIPTNLDGVNLVNPSSSTISIAGALLKDIPGTSESTGQCQFLPIGIRVNLNRLKNKKSKISSYAGQHTSLAAPIAECYMVNLTPASYVYINQHGTNIKGEALSSSLSREVVISFSTVLTTSFNVSSGALPAIAYYATGGTRSIYGYGIGSGTAASSMVTCGSADNSIPQVPFKFLGRSIASGIRSGIWFKSLWKNTNSPDLGTKFTVKSPSGEYLSPIKLTNGGFGGWKYSSDPYDFTVRNSKGIFSFGGLAWGTYTVTEVNSPGNTSSPLSFTVTLSPKWSSPDALFPIPEEITPINDPENLLNPADDVVYSEGKAAANASSDLPLTGGAGWILGISLFAILLFISGGLLDIVYFRKGGKEGK